MTNTVLIVGGGGIGTHLATLLLASNHRVKLIEMRREELVRLQHKVPEDSVVIGNGADPTVLEVAGIRQAQVVAAVTGADETNLVVTSLARFEFQIPRTIARVHTPQHAWMFTPAMGVDVVLNQADVMAHLIAEEMSLGDMITLLKLRKGQYALVEEQVHPRALAVGKSIGELPLPPECSLTAIIRRGQLLIPHSTVVLQPHDEVLALVHATQATQLAALLGHND